MFLRSASFLASYKSRADPNCLSTVHQVGSKPTTIVDTASGDDVDRVAVEGRFVALNCILVD